MYKFLLKPTLACFFFILLGSGHLSAQNLLWYNEYVLSGATVRGDVMFSNNNAIYTAGEETDDATSVNKLRVLKHSSAGVMLISNFFSFGNVSLIKVNSIKDDASGNIYVLLTVDYNTSASSDAYVISYDPSLAYRWIRIVNFDTFDNGMDLSVNTNGVYVLSTCGLLGTGSRYGIKRLDAANGNELMTYTNVSTSPVYATSLRPDSSGNIYIGGRNSPSTAFPNSKVGFLTKHGPTGLPLWSNSINISGLVNGSTYNEVNDILIDNISNYVYVCGLGSGTGVTSTAYLRRYSTGGLLQSAVVYGSLGQGERFTSIKKEFTGDITVNGYNSLIQSFTTTVFRRTYSPTLATVVSSTNQSISTGGNLLYKVLTLNNPNGSSVHAVNSRFVAGGSVPYCNVVKLSSAGAVMYNSLLSEYVQGIARLPLTAYPNNDYVLLKTYESTGWRLAKYTSAPGRVEDDVVDTGIEFYPVPANDVLNVSGIQPEGVQIYDLTGKLQECNVTVTAKGAAIDVSHLSNGLYIICDGNGKSEKFLVQH